MYNSFLYGVGIQNMLGFWGPLFLFLFYRHWTGESEGLSYWPRVTGLLGSKAKTSAQVNLMKVYNSDPLGHSHFIIHAMLSGIHGSLS